MADSKKSDNSKPAEDPAVNVIRAKIDQLYKNEPQAKEELAEAAAPGPHSKHQRFMMELSKSGKSLADIQTEWHNYYVNLPDEQKHAVWQEFYQQHGRSSQAQPADLADKVTESNDHAPTYTKMPAHTNPTKSVSQLKKQLLSNARGTKLSKKQHFKSLLFGAGIGLITLVIILFSFFNERFIAPFITPSKSVSSTSIIIDPDSTAVGNEAKIIIPKINVEIPVVYDLGTTEESAIQSALEDGVVHYASTPNPGEQGNSVIVGHSSNNIFNSGKYKFAFVLLKQLEDGDTFMLTKGGKRYVYKVYDKKIVKPTDVSVLGPSDKPASVTLITCDPPGTSINRLIVLGEQITPDPSKNIKSKVQTANIQPLVVPGNAPSLWSRFWGWLAN